MKSILKISALLIILTVQCHGVAKPFMRPLGRKLELNPGEPLTIVCVSWINMKFIRPAPGILNGIKSSDAKEIVINKKPYSWLHMLHIPSTTIADSGFYGCANDNVDIDVTRHDQKNVAWIEVIVPNW